MRSGTIYTIVIYLLTWSFVPAQQGKPLFNQNCAVCHQIGKGPLVGPDLQGVNERRSDKWLLRFVKSSQSMIKSGDPDAVEIYNTFNQSLMPDFKHLSDNQITAILDYVKGQSKPSPAMAEAEDDTSVSAGSTGTPTAETQKRQFDVPTTPENIAAGRQLFTGRQRLTNGGPSCISCHDVNDKQSIINGGNYAIDMTDIVNMRGANVVHSMIVNPAFPEMQKAFGNQPVTEEEANLITAYLISLSEDQPTKSFASWDELFNWWLRSSMDKFGLFGAAFCLFVLLLGLAATVFWPGRKSGSVNDRIYQRQIDSV